MKKCSLLLFFIISFIGAQAQLVVTPGGGAAVVASAVGGPGLTISNVTINCAAGAYGAFSNGAASGMGINNGLILTTGSAAALPGSPNVNDDFSTCLGTTGTDAQLSSVLGGASIHDPCIIQFDVVPQCNNMSITFVFGSDEYMNWVSQGYNDGFGFFVSGPNPSGGSYTNQNIAVLPSGTLVTIDNVNSSSSDASYYVNNGGFANHFDGFTTVLSPSINVTPCATYHFKLAIADAGDCYVDSGVLIDIIQCVSPWTATTSSTPASCGATNGTATTTVSGGIGPFTYSWAPSGGTGATASGLAAGSYTVTVNDGISCTPAQTYTVTVGGSGGSATTINSPTICAGSSTTLTDTPGTGGGTYSWAPGGATTQIITVSPASTTTYTCSYTLSGCTTTSTGTVTVNPLPTVTINAATVCNGTAATLTATPSITGGTYSWAPGGATTAAITITPGTTTTYTVTYTKTGCTATGTGTVTVNPVPTVTVNSPTVCSGTASTLTATPSATGGTYSWTPGGATTAAITVTPGTTTTYTVTYALAGCSNTGTGTVTVNPVPTVTVNSATVCNGTATTLTATPSITGGTYAWAPGGATTAAITVTPGTTTTYTVTYTKTGCTATGTGTVTVNPIPTTAVNSATICPGGTANLTATGGTTYSWSNSSTTNPISVSPASTTSYTVTGTTSGCSNTAVATVTVGSTTTITVNSPAICAGQTATLTASGATTYTWSAGATSTGTTTATATPAATTTYTVTGVTGTCSGTAVATVTVNAIPTVTVTSPTVCNGTTATITASGATSYTWSAGATASGTTAATATPASTTSYTVTGTTLGCSNTTVSTVTVNPIPTVTVNSPTICPGTTATLTASGATSYTWSAGATSTGTSTATASPASTTTYTVTGTSSGCTNTAVSTVTVATALVITVNSPTICAGTTASLTASGADAYTWSTGATTTGTSTADASPTTTTTYTVNGTTGSCSGTAIATVTVTPMPTVTVDSPAICAGQTATMTAGGADSYTWSAGATTSGTSTATAAPATTTTYTVTGTTSGCSTTAVSTVTANPVPVTTVNSPSVCPGSIAMLTANGATSYTWSTGATSTGTNTATAAPASTTTYTVTGNSLGCTSTAIATVTINTVLSVDAGPDDTICYGGNTNLTVTPNGAGYTYSWSSAASLSSGTVYNPNATPAVTTTYGVIVTDASGCSGSDSVTVFADPQITLAVAGLPTTCNGTCDGQTIVIPSGGSGTYPTYAWSGGCATPACNQCAGNYTVTVTDSWGCTATNSATVTEPAVLTNTIATPTMVSCFGVCDGAATASGTGGTGPYAYSWSTVPAQTTATASNLCAGTYTCTITDAHNCTAIDSVVITQPIQVILSPLSNVTICNSGTTTLVTEATGGNGPAYTYSWTATTGLSDPAIPNPVASPVTTTTYTVNATDVNGCPAISQTVTVTVNPALSVTTLAAAPICPGSSVNISAHPVNGNGGPYTYSWSPSTGLSNAASGSPDAAPAATTTYTVTVTDGCSPAVTATVLVTVLPVPVPAFTADVRTGCSPLCVTLTDASTISSGAISGWSWDLDDGTGTTDVHGQNQYHCFTDPHTYSITLTDTSDAGCITSVTYSNYLTVNAIPHAAFTAPASTSVITPTVPYTDESTVTNGSIISWSWNFGDILDPLSNTSHLENPSHTFSEVGTYCAHLLVTSSNGCTDSTDVCIVIDPEFTFYIPNAFTPNGDGINDEFYGKGDFIHDYEMYIYDRWGNMIFFTDDINKHWDGKANHGSDIAQQDVYVYVIKLKDNYDKSHKYIGSVTLVK